MKKDIVPYDTFKEIAIDTWDDIIKSVLSNTPFLSQVPLVSVAVGFINSYKGYAEYRLKRKLASFLYECKDLNTKEILKFISRYAEDEEKVGILMLDELYNLDSDRKAQFAGRLFKYCVKHELEIDSYHRILNSVDKCYFKDLLFLVMIEQMESFVNTGVEIPGEVIIGLFNAGFLSEMGIDGGGFSDDNPGGIIYSLNRYGEIVVEILKM